MILLIQLLVSIAFGTSNIELKVDPDRLYTLDDKAVLFTTKFTPPPGVGRLAVVQLTETGQIKKHLGFLNDDGVLGDSKKQDGIWSRRVRFKGHTASKLQLALAWESTATSANSQYLAKNELEFIRRPNFPQLLSQVWHRLTGFVSAYR